MAQVPLVFDVAVETVFHFPPTLFCNFTIAPTWGGETLPVKLYEFGFIALVGQFTFETEVNRFAVTFVAPGMVSTPGTIEEM